MSNLEITERKKSILDMPIATIFLIYLVVVLLTFVVPSGEFQRFVDDATGITLIDAESFNFITKKYIGFMGVFTSMFNGFAQAVDIILLCFFSSFYIRVLTVSGAFKGSISALILKLGNKKKLVLPLLMLVISLAGFTYGETEDLYPLMVLFVSTAIMLGYDGLTGLAISAGPVVIGFSTSAFNPYTVGYAQQIAELPLYSGAWFRTIMYIIMISAYIWWVMRYTNALESGKIKSYVEDIDYSSIHDSEAELHSEFTGKHKVLMLLLVAVITAMIIGASKFGWYFTEIGALFLMGGIFSSMIMRYSMEENVTNFIEGFKDIMMGVIVIGLARSILVVMQETMIIDSVIHFLFQGVKFLPNVLVPVGMLIVQTITNFFIPSGSGQAAASMPIMTPLADMLAVNRQVAVLAFQLGDGLANLLWPTCAIAVFCGLSNVPLQRWYKLFIPFYVIMLILSSVFLVVAQIMQLGPF